MWKKSIVRAWLAAIGLVINVIEAEGTASKFEGLDVSMSVNAQEISGIRGQVGERMLKKRLPVQAKTDSMWCPGKQFHEFCMCDGGWSCRTHFCECEEAQICCGFTAPPTSAPPTSAPPTSAPSTSEDIDEWYLAFTNTTLGNHTDALDGMVLEYHVAKDKNESQLKSNIYDESCLNMVDDPSVTVSDVILEELIGMEYDAGAVSIDIDKNTIQNSTFWNSESSAMGVIGFCVRTELWTEDISTSVSFSDTVVHSSIDFEAGFASFEIDDIELLKLNATEIEETTDMQATACICDNSYVCDDEPVLAQNSPFNVCVNPVGDNLQVSEFKSLNIYQDMVDKFIPIIDGVVSSSITEVIPGSVGMIKTRMVSTFFQESDPMDVTITGTVILDFADGTAPPARSLEGKDHRVLKRGSNQKVVFQLNVGLDKSFIQSTPQFNMILGAFAVVGVFAVMFLLKRRKEGGGYVAVNVDEEATD